MSKSTLKGVQVWIDTFNLAATTANILLGDMILDSDDDILITGAVYNGSNNYDALTLKYTNAGSLSWYELYDGSASFYDGGLRIAVDANDKVFVTGGTSSSTSNMDLLVLAYQDNGTLDWSATYDGYSAFDAGSYVKAVSLTTVHVVAVSEVVSGSNTKWVVTDRKYDTSDGSLIVSASSSQIGLSEVRDVALDASDNIYVVGWKPTTSQGRDIVVVKLNDGAVIQWEKSYNGTADADDQPNAITVAANADEDYLFQRRSASTGSLVHELTFAGWVGGDDRAEMLLEDADGGIIMSGKTAAGASGQFPTAVRFAKADYFLPPNSETPNASLPYIHQFDQLTTTDGKIADDIKYYASNHYLENDRLSLVQSRIDTVPSNPDTLCRVDVSFSTDKSQRVFALDKRSSYHNYLLPGPHQRRPRQSTLERPSTAHRCLDGHRPPARQQRPGPHLRHHHRNLG